MLQERGLTTEVIAKMPPAGPMLGLPQKVFETMVAG